MQLVRITPFTLLVTVAAQAATSVPNAGVLGNQLRQQIPTATPSRSAAPLSLPTGMPSANPRDLQGGIHVTLSKVMFEGDIQQAGIPLTRLEAAVANKLNPPLTFGGLQQLADQVTTLYREEGLLTARVILPPQTVKDGVLRLQVIVGRYDAGKIQNTSAMRTSVAERIVSATTPQGEVIRLAQLEREALLLSELPGVNARMSLMAGTKPGTSTPVVDITPGARVSGYVGLDNQGDETTGRSRVMAGVQVNNPLGLGDSLNVDLMDAWEKSDLFNGSLNYSMPVGGYGTRTGLSYTHLNYHYSLLQNSFSGYSDYWGLYVTHPWVRSATTRIDVRLDSGQQYLTDKYPSTLFGSLGDKGRKQINLLSPSLTGSVAAVPGGVTGFSLRGTVGDVSYRNDLARLISFSDEAGTAGHFARLNWAANHEQSVWGPFSVYGSLSGQFTDHNQDSSQKLLLGGPTAVRAYDTGDGSVDEGSLFTTEVRSRWDLSLPALIPTPATLTVAAFFDQGWGNQYDSNRSRSGGVLTDHNQVNLSGAGLYTTLSEAGNVR